MSVCIPVPPAIVDPVLEAKVVQDLQNLFAGLSWLENCYPLVRTGVEKMEQDANFKYPQVYAGLVNNKVEYYALRPNDNLKSYCFFEIEAPYQYDAQQEMADYFLSVVFWFNLPKIDARNYDFSPELRGDVLRLLRSSTYQGKIGDIEVETRPEEIFSKYSFDQKESQFMMYPFGAFKIKFRITEEADCNLPFTATSPNSCEN